MPETDSSSGSSPDKEMNRGVDMVMPDTDSEYSEKEVLYAKDNLVMPDTDLEYSVHGIPTTDENLIMPETDSDYSGAGVPPVKPNNLVMPDTDSEYSPQGKKTYSERGCLPSKHADPRLIMPDFDSHMEDLASLRYLAISAKGHRDLSTPGLETDPTSNTMSNNLSLVEVQPVPFQNIENMSGSE